MTQRNEKSKNEKKSSLLYMTVLGAVALALLTTMVPSTSLANALTQYAGNGGNGAEGGTGGTGGASTASSGNGGEGGASSEGGSGGSSSEGGSGGNGGNIGEELLDAALELVGAEEYVGENSANGGNGGDSTGGAGGDSTAGAGGDGGSTSETNGGNADGGAGGRGGDGGHAIAICNAFACNDDGIPIKGTPAETV
jgi:hypothetical protein